LFHLHTLTIEATITPPPPFIAYRHRPDEANPEHLAFVNVRDGVKKSTSPYDLLTIIPSSRRVLKPPKSLSLTGRQHEPPGLGSVYLPDQQFTPLVHFPALLRHGNHEWLKTSDTWDLQNWLHAALAMEPKMRSRKVAYHDDKERFILETSVQICWVPDGEGEDAGAELKMIVTIDLRVDMDLLFDPLPPIGHEMRGLILHSLFPAPVAPSSKTESEARASALRYFYGCLNPAPDLSLNFDVGRLQPKEMASKLLPFQTRTVGLLLERERSRIIGEAKATTHHLPGIWEGVQLGQGSGKVAYRRMTGDIRRIEGKLDKGKGRAAEEEGDMNGLSRSERENLPLLLDLSQVRGTMLCEEMGESPTRAD
jgi:E3 ubiquitin-protein ligase SHPRH